MMSLEVPLGKLALVRYRPPLTSEELTQFLMDVREAVQRSDGPLVFCTDWRGNDGFPDDMADTIVWIMRRDNPKIRANGVLVSPEHASFAAQVGTILAQAGNPNRRMFTDVDGLCAFLEPLLDDDERTRLGEFLGG